MIKKAINLHASSLEEMGARFVAAWKTVERGRKPARDHATVLAQGPALNHTASSPRA